MIAGIEARERFDLSSTMLAAEDGLAHTSRACVLSFRTHRLRIDAPLADLNATIAGLARSA